MTRKLNTREILEKNRRVDRKQLREVERMMGELRKFGIYPVEYDLASPFDYPLVIRRETDATPNEALSE